MKTAAWLALGACALSLSACASTPVPADKLTRSQVAIRSARDLGAEQVPPAAMHLRIATEQVDLARKAMSDGDNKKAEYLLIRAEADAEAAIALSNESIALAAAQRTREDVQRLRSSMKTTTPKEGT